MIYLTCNSNICSAFYPKLFGGQFSKLDVIALPFYLNCIVSIFKTTEMKSYYTHMVSHESHLMPLRMKSRY